MKLIDLKEIENVLVIELSEKAEKINISALNNYLTYEIFPLRSINMIQLPQGKWNILGTINKKGKYSFDPTELIDWSGFNNIDSIRRCFAEMLFIAKLMSYDCYVWQLGKPDIFYYKEYPLTNEQKWDKFEWLDIKDFDSDMQKWEESKQDVLKEGNVYLILQENAK